MPPRPPATSFVATAVVDGLPPVTTSDHDWNYQAARMNGYPSFNAGKSLVLNLLAKERLERVWIKGLGDTMGRI